MRPRLPFLLLAVLLSTGVAFLPACKKKDEGGGGGGGGDPFAGLAAPGTVGTDYVLFAHLNAKEIRESALFAELKSAVMKAGGSAEWDLIEGDASKDIGMKPTDVDSVTLCVTDFPPKDEPGYVLIIKGNKPVDKTSAFKMKPGTKPDSRGFYQMLDGYLHFPDDKTAVFLHESLAEKYLEGFGRDRTGWPLTAELTKAASGHTAFAVLRVDKIPADGLDSRVFKDFAPLLAAKTITLTADLRGRNLSVSGRATFADAASAGKGKDMIVKFITAATTEVETVLKSKNAADFAGLMPAVKEAHRALKAAQVDVNGTELTLAGSYKADFDFGVMMTEAVKKVRNAAGRMASANNLKQLGTALHNFASVNNDQIVIHGIGPNGALIQNPKDKPLLSWRVALLPYIEEGELYKQFKLDEPWDSEHNKKLIAKMPKIYTPVNKSGKPGYTHLQMVIGPNAMQPYVARMPASFPDGTSNTIAVVEAAEPVIWTKPDDVVRPAKFAPGELKKKFGGLHPGGFNVALWDGSVRFISDSISEQTLGLAIDPSDGLPLGSDW